MNDMTTDHAAADQSGADGTASIEAPVSATADTANEQSYDETQAEPGGRPHGLPDKFWDQQRGEIRADALANSYISLEQRFSAAESNGVPKEPSGYEINVGEHAPQVDVAVNEKLHQAGFNQSQAQLVYDMAGEYLAPMVTQMAMEFTAQNEVDKLAHHFGGEDRWREMSAQVHEWGKANLGEDVLRSMSSNMEGVKAIHAMMAGEEPAMMQNGQAAGQTESEAGLRALMRDPKYWRDHDPAIVEQVKQGFQRLYPDEE
jgi:hypothetical protein